MEISVKDLNKFRELVKSLSTYVPREKFQDSLDSFLRTTQNSNMSIYLLIADGGMGKTSILKNLESHILHSNINLETEKFCIVPSIDAENARNTNIVYIFYHILENLAPFFTEHTSIRHDLIEEFNDQARFLLNVEDSEIAGINTDSNPITDIENQLKDKMVKISADLKEIELPPILISFDTMEQVLSLEDVNSILNQIRQNLHNVTIIFAARPQLTNEKNLESFIKKFARNSNTPYETFHLQPFDYSEAKTFFENLQSNTKENIETSDIELDNILMLTGGRPLKIALTGFAKFFGHIKNIDTLSAKDYFTAILCLEGIDQRPNSNKYPEIRKVIVRIIKLAAIIREPITKDIWGNLIVKSLKDTKNVDTQGFFWLTESPSPLSSNVSDLFWESVNKLPWMRSRFDSQSFTLHDSLAEKLLDEKKVEYDVNTTSIFQQFAEYNRSIAGDIWNDFTSTSVNKAYAQYIHYQFGLNVEKALEEFVTSLNKSLDEYQFGLAREIVNVFEKISFNFPHRFYQQKLDDEARIPEFPLKDINQIITQTIWKFLSQDSNLRSQLIHAIARFYKVELRYHKAEELLSFLYKDLQKDGDIEENDLEKYNIHFQRALSSMKMPQYYIQAENDLLEALDIASQNYELYPYIINKSLGDFYVQQGRINESSSYYQEAIRQSARPILSVNDLKHICQLNIAYARSLALKADFLNAFSIIETALQQATSLKDKLLEANSLSCKGEIYRYSHNFSIALKSHQEAENIFANEQIYSHLAREYYHQSMCLYHSLKDYQRRQKTNELIYGKSFEEGKEYMIERIQIALELSERFDRINLPRIYRHKGEMWLLNNNYTKALGNVNISIDIASAYDSTRELLNGLISRLEILVERSLLEQIFDLDELSNAFGELEDQWQQKSEWFHHKDEILQGRYLILKGHYNLILRLYREEKTTENDLRKAVGFYIAGFPHILPTYLGNYDACGMPVQFYNFVTLLQYIQDYNVEIYTRIYKYMIREWSRSPLVTKELSGALISLLQSKDLIFKSTSYEERY